MKLIATLLCIVVTACGSAGLRAPRAPTRFADAHVLEVPRLPKCMPAPSYWDDWAAWDSYQATEQEDCNPPEGVPPRPPSTSPVAPAGTATVTANLNVSLPSGTGGGSYESAIINGITDFVVSRSKQEVIDFLVETLGKRLCEHGQRWDVGSYFPATCALIDDLGQDGAGLSVQKLGGMFRGALESDVKSLVPIVLNAAVSFTLPASLSKYQAFVPLLVEVASGMRDGEHPLALIVDAFGGLDCDGRDDTYCGLRAAALVIRALTISDADWRHVDETDVQETANVIKRIVDTLNSLLDAKGNAKVKKWAQQKFGRSEDALDKLVTTAWKGAVALEAATEWGTPADWTATGGRVDRTLDFLASLAELSGNKASATFIKTAAGLWHEREEWIATARGLFAVADALWKGTRNPLDVAMSAASVFPCAEDTDVGCAVRIVSLAVKAIVLAKGELPSLAGDGGALAVFSRDLDAMTNHVEDAMLKFQSLIGHEAAPVQRLYKRYFLEQSDRLAFVQRVLEAIQLTARLAAEVDNVDIAKEARAGLEFKLYASAIDALTLAFDLVLSSEQAQRLRLIVNDITRARNALVEGDVATLLAASFSLADETGVSDALPDSLKKYAPLVNDLLAAKTGSEVSTALEKHAAPIGSWRRKRVHEALFSVAAFVGGTVGTEWTDFESTSTTMDSTGKHLALFAPVGLDFTWGSYGCIAKETWCLAPSGLYASVIDVGTLTALRFKDEGGAEAPNTTFMQVFSPGLFLRFSPWKSPFVLGGGMSLVPGLRGTESADTSVTWRAHVFVGIDVNILTL